MNQPLVPEVPDWVTDFLDPYASKEVKRDLIQAWKIISVATPEINQAEVYEVVRKAVESLPEQERPAAAVEAVKAAINRWARENTPADWTLGKPW